LTRNAGFGKARASDLKTMASMEKDITDYISFDNMDLELWICTVLLKLESLHYGYWNNGESLNLDNLRIAQARYTEELISNIPERVETVLDVGCGIGDNARAMAARGYRVTALSPDKNHKKYFDRANHSRIKFYNQEFENLSASEKFDLVLMSESQNYFDAEVGFHQCRRLLNDGGYLLVCGMFRYDNSSAFKHVRNIESEYVAKAAGHKFELTRRVDITERVLPNLQLANEASREYLAPAYDVLKYYLKHSSPLKLRLFKILCSKELKNLSKIQHYYREFCDPALFQKRVKYLTLLFTSSQ